MHVPLLARTHLPTFYLYGRTYFHYHNVNILYKVSRPRVFDILCSIKCTLWRLCHVHFDKWAFRDIPPILQPQGYRLNRLQPQHIFYIRLRQMEIYFSKNISSFLSLFEHLLRDDPSSVKNENNIQN
jgi:hypothetical protein